MNREVVLVGELNPYGSDPKFALYPLPRHASGDRLCRLVMGLRVPTYMAFTRYNLCTGKWSTRAARVQARAILAQHPNGLLVLLGARVTASFFGPACVYPTLARPSEFSLARMEDGTDIVVLPHPSGLCRIWNEPGAHERARGVLRIAAPWVKWGEMTYEVTVQEESP